MPAGGETGTDHIQGTDYLVPPGTVLSGTNVPPGAIPIQNTTVVLSFTDVNGNTVTVPTQTNALGQYIFNNLNSGTYTVTETPPAGDAHLGQTASPRAAVTTPATNPVVSNIVLGSKPNPIASIDNFYEVAPITASISGADYLVSNTTTADSLTTATAGVPIAGTRWS